MTPIAEQPRKKSVRRVRDTDDRRLADVYEMFAAPAGATSSILASLRFNFRVGRGITLSTVWCPGRLSHGYY